MAPRGRPPKHAAVAVAEPPVRTMDPDEKARVETELRQTEAMLKAPEQFTAVDGYAPTIPAEVALNKSAMENKARELRAVLDRETPQKETNESRRNSILARRKQLEELFAPILETYQDIGCIRSDTPEFRAAFNKAVKRPGYEKYIAEWKELGRKLDPEDPDINNLDRLRRDR